MSKPSSAAFKDHFSGHAERYGEFRPTYPPALFQYLADLAPERGLAWDCGTGNGQAAVALADHFAEVIASDPSARQIENAKPHPKVRYFVAAPDKPPAKLLHGSADLITAAQALHWFDHDQFYRQARLAAKSGGIIAVWCYQIHSVNPEIDEIVKRYYSEIVGPYWPPERLIVEQEYKTLPFPFEEIAPPPFRMAESWTLPRLIGYLGTWSSSQRYRVQNGADPVSLIRDELVEAWGDPERPREVVWPLHPRVGRIP